MMARFVSGMQEQVFALLQSKVVISSVGVLIQTLEGPEDIEWAEWHSKGNAVLAGSRDGTIWMWMAHNGQCVQVFTGRKLFRMYVFWEVYHFVLAGHNGGVSTGCFSRDGKNVISGGDDGTVRVWAPKTGACKHVFEGHFAHSAVVTCLVGSNEGDFILTGKGLSYKLLNSWLTMILHDEVNVHVRLLMRSEDRFYFDVILMNRLLSFEELVFCLMFFTLIRLCRWHC
jgi:WD40 repeat protein